MIVSRLVNALVRCVGTYPDPFMTYKAFAQKFGFSDRYPPAWANKNTLDPVAELLKKDAQIGLDLTFLIRSRTTGFPSVIDGAGYRKGNRNQEQRARDVANQIIKKVQPQSTESILDVHRGIVTLQRPGRRASDAHMFSRSACSRRLPDFPTLTNLSACPAQTTQGMVQGCTPQ